MGNATTDDERAAHLLALGSLGTVPATLLDHPEPAVRIAAALAPSWGDDPRALEVLRHALEDAEASDRWFDERPPQMQMRPRFSVVRALLDREVPFDDLLEGALAISRCTSRLCVDFDWGPLLAAAFAPNPGRVETPAQHRYLRALVDRDDLWQPRFGNADRWFRQAALPYDRDACAALVDATTAMCSSTGRDDAPS